MFLYLLNSAAAVLLLVWILVACSQLRLRPQLERTAPDRLTVRMWGYPYLTWLALAAMVGVLVLMLTDTSARTQVISAGALAAAAAAIAWPRESRFRRAKSAEPS